MKVDRLIGGAWAVACTGLFTTIAVLRFVRVEPISYDHAIFEEAVRAYSRFGLPIVPIKGPHFNLLGDHFSPILATLGPVYRLFPAAQTLMVAQAALLGWSVYVITVLALRVCGRPVGVVLAVAYGLSFGLQSAVVAGFHEVAFGAPLLALAGAAFTTQRYGAVVAWAVPLLLVKEDLGLTVAAIGLALIVVGEHKRGALLAVGGSAGLALSVFVLIPWARSDGSGYPYALGGDGVMGALFDAPGEKALTTLLTLGVGGLVAVASPWAIAAVPTLTWRFAADNPYYWGTGFHYSLLLMPIASIAAIDAIRRRPALRIPGMVLAAGFTVASIGGSPAANLLKHETWQPTARQIAAEEVLARIPTGVRVDTDIGLMTQLVTGRDVTFIGTPGNALPDWVVLDHDPATGPSAAQYATLRYGHQFETVVGIAGFDVARRVD